MTLEAAAHEHATSAANNADAAYRSMLQARGHYESAESAALHAQSQAQNAQANADDVRDKLALAQAEYTRAEQELRKAQQAAAAVKPIMPEDDPNRAGLVLRVKQVNADGSFVCEWAEGGSGGGISDVKLNGESVVTGGVANVDIPQGVGDTWSLVKAKSSNGLYGVAHDGQGGYLKIYPASANDIANRTGNPKPITPSVLNAAIIAGLTDGNRIVMNDDQTRTAQSTLGIVTLTQEEYDLLPIKNESTIYLIVG